MSLLLKEPSVIFWSLAVCVWHAVCTIHACRYYLQGYEADRFITPPKRTMTQPYVARQGEWVAVNQMSCINGDGHGELYTTGNSVFVLGADDQPYVCGESLCLVCDQASMVQDRGSDLVECDRCMGAVHLHCAALSKVPKVNIVQKTQQSAGVALAKMSCKEPTLCCDLGCNELGGCHLGLPLATPIVLCLQLRMLTVMTG